LHVLAQRGGSDSARTEARYALGVALADLQYDQLAAIQFVEVIRSGVPRFQRNSIERLSLLADRLGDETLLNYALSKVLVSDLPEKNRDLVLLRLGENQLRKGQFAAAQSTFQKIESGSKYFYQAQFNRGLALLEANQPAQAVPVFQNLYSLNTSQSVQHPQKVAAQMGWARALYQAQDFNRSLDIYRKIPRDSEMWVDSIFESAWASFRATKFRTVLSQFQSLHSGFFEEHYQPESLLLRSLVYLYICQFDEMEKTLGLFEKDYYPVRNILTRFLVQNRDPALFVDEFVKSGGSKVLPIRVVRFLQKEGDVRRGVDYLKKISDERKRLESLGSGSFSSYARSALDQRTRNARTAFGDLLQFRLRALLADLEDLIEQAAFAKYEMIGGKKEQIKKKISEESSRAVDRSITRKYYIQNGFEYWPFQGEYWLDELGNYQYVGQSSCS
ncbi:MAG: tetratricopeptide repeat protein, partial [Bdellovibrio sp.]